MDKILLWSLGLLAVIGVAMIVALMSKPRERSGDTPMSTTTSSSLVATRPSSKIDYKFGYKIAWLAIRSDDRARVVEALHITGCEAVEWREGIAAAYDEKGAFVSNPVQR